LREVEAGGCRWRQVEVADATVLVRVAKHLTPLQCHGCGVRSHGITRGRETAVPVAGLGTPLQTGSIVGEFTKSSSVFDGDVKEGRGEAGGASGRCRAESHGDCGCEGGTSCRAYLLQKPVIGYVFLRGAGATSGALAVESVLGELPIPRHRLRLKAGENITESPFFRARRRLYN
jgi:hypothetical protein